MKRRMRFGTWCRKDLDDDTKIVYTFKMKDADGNSRTAYFTSDDKCSFSMIWRLRNAWIERIDRVENEFECCWNVVLYED